MGDLDRRNEFAKYEQDEALQFRQEIQGNRRIESDDEDDFGPKPMVQSKELFDQKKVSFVQLYFHSFMLCNLFFLFSRLVTEVLYCLEKVLLLLNLFNRI